jgi:8-oxo-dGTP pyrophosphatase MutT (NUDIX family)
MIPYFRRMHHEQILDLQNRLSLPLPGAFAQNTMAPPFRDEYVKLALSQNSNPKQSAVLILLYPQEEILYTVLILRLMNQRDHAGQIAFPGGKKEESDKDLLETALREAEEEIGIKRNEVHLLGKLTELYIPVSGFMVQPIVGYMKNMPEFSFQSGEVQEIIKVSMDELSSPSIVRKEKILLQNQQIIETPVYTIHNHLIWGATAMIIAELIAVLKEVQKVQQ